MVKFSAVLTSLLWLGSAVGVAASAQESDSRPIIVLRGVLESKKAPRPPGRGESQENGRKLIVYLLKLPMAAPASGLALPDDLRDPPNGFQELQLVCDYPGYPECDAILKKSISHPVRVVGQTSRPAEPVEQLQVIMHLRLITVLQ